MNQLVPYHMFEARTAPDIYTPEFAEFFGNWKGAYDEVYNSDEDLYDSLEDYFTQHELSKAFDFDLNLPVKVYHGSNARFDAFDKNARSHYSAAAEMGGGIYFTDNVSIARSYGDIIYTAYLNITNPYERDFGGGTFKEHAGEMRAISRLVSQGTYDGAIVRNIIDDSTGKSKRYKPSTVYIVSDPQQIWMVN